MKLIRDRLADIEWPVLPEGRRLVRPVIDRNEHLRLLKLKLLEECGELMDTTTPQQAAKEAADLLQVIDDYLTVMGVYRSEVENVRRAKMDRYGGFSAGTVWDI